MYFLKQGCLVLSREDESISILDVVMVELDLGILDTSSVGYISVI